MRRNRTRRPGRREGTSMDIEIRVQGQVIWRQHVIDPGELEIAVFGGELIRTSWA